MIRKIIQVFATEVQNTERWQGGYTMVALCDDSTIWTQYNGSKWVQVEGTEQITGIEGETSVPCKHEWFEGRCVHCSQSAKA